MTYIQRLIPTYSCFEEIQCEKCHLIIPIKSLCLQLYTDHFINGRKDYYYHLQCYEDYTDLQEIDKIKLKKDKKLLQALITQQTQQNHQKTQNKIQQLKKKITKKTKASRKN